MAVKLYFAPLEGITGYIYRNTFQRHFAGIDKYFIPFIQPKQHGHFSSREKQDILPEHNAGLRAVPQLLTNSAHDFLLTAEKLEALGYRELNLNLGCPSRTVVTKGRGAGQLKDQEKLDRFLDEIFRGAKAAISVKTRIGMSLPEEFAGLLEIFERYPLAELIIHPRVQQEYYEGQPHMEAFSAAMAAKKLPVCYNGDIISETGCQKLLQQYPDLDRVMLGRGLLRRPGLARQITTGQKATKQELMAFHEDLYQSYQEVLSGDRTILFKMKELWVYLVDSFEKTESRERWEKKIKKAQKLAQYEEAIRGIWEDCELQDLSAASEQAEHQTDEGKDAPS